MILSMEAQGTAQDVSFGRTMRKTEEDPSHGKRIAWNWMFRKFKNHAPLPLPSLAVRKASIGACNHVC